jgi:hypothetical protein
VQVEVEVEVEVEIEVDVGVEEGVGVGLEMGFAAITFSTPAVEYTTDPIMTNTIRNRKKTEWGVRIQVARRLRTIFARLSIQRTNLFIKEQDLHDFHYAPLCKLYHNNYKVDQH